MLTIDQVLGDKNFPVAIDPFFIAKENSEEDKKIRAQAIIDLWLKEPFDGKKILDFGCGLGHLTEEIANRDGDVIGYDFAEIPKRSKGKFTNNWKDIVDNAPYDLIILYDVIDHAEGHPVEILNKCKSVISRNGKVRVRCHPWCNRHGAHLFHKANKAFLQLLFPQDELIKAGITGPKTINVIHPVATYQGWFTKVGFKIMESKVYRKDIEPIFMTEPYRSLIVKNWKYSQYDETLRNGTGFPGYAMDQEFVDYTLT